MAAIFTFKNYPKILNIYQGVHIRNFAILLILFICLKSKSQEGWKTNANLFLTKCDNFNYSKLSLADLDSLISNAGEFITTFKDTAFNETLSIIFAARADMRLEKLRRVFKTLSTFTKLDTLGLNIEQGYQKAIELCNTCKCKYLHWLKELYLLENYAEKVEITDAQIIALGGSGEWPTALGFAVNYIPQANIVGVEFGITSGGRVFQKKVRDPKTGKKYRACSYEYPVAFGVLSVGYERAFGNSDYSAFKISPVWINAILALNPLQFLYATNSSNSSFVWRPEIGVCFSGFSINYGYNLSFTAKFDQVPNHLLSIKFAFPFFKFGRSSYLVTTYVDP